jgi:tetratricopeptide (TPR) repeat protein
MSAPRNLKQEELTDSPELVASPDHESVSESNAEPARADEAARQSTASAAAASTQGNSLLPGGTPEYKEFPGAEALLQEIAGHHDVFQSCQSAMERLRQNGSPKTGHALDYNEQAAAALAQVIFPVYGLLFLGTLAAYLGRLLGHTLTPFDTRSFWQLLLIFIPMCGLGLTGWGILGRFVAQKGWYRTAEFLLKLSYLPSRRFPNGALGSSLAERSLCDFYLANGRLRKAKKLAYRLQARSTSPECQSLAKSHLAELLADAHDSPEFERIATDAADSFERLASSRDIHDRTGRELYNHLGQAYLNAGQYDKSRTCFLRSLGLQQQVHKLDQDALVGSIVGIAATHLRSNQLEEALRWLNMLESYRTKSGCVSHHFQNELILLHAEAEMRAGDLQASSHRLIEAQSRLCKNPSNDVAYRCLDLFGAIALRQDHLPEAEKYMRRSLALKRGLLPESHPLIIQGKQDLAKVLHSEGNSGEALRLQAQAQSDSTEFEHERAKEASTYAATETCIRDPQRQKKQVSSRQRLMAFVFVVLILHSAYSLVDGGLRAVDPFLWSSSSALMLLAAVLGYVLLSAKLSLRTLRKLVANAEEVTTDVAFNRLIKNEGLMTEVLQCQLGDPFNSEHGVRLGNWFVLSNLATYGQRAPQTVLAKNGKPFAVRLANDEIVELSSTDVHQEYVRQIKRALAFTALLLAVILGPIAYGISSYQEHEQLPSGLTAFEYYRCGAHRIATDWREPARFYDIDTVKQALDKAIALDANGPIGRYAKQCEIGELPINNPTRDDLIPYEEAINGHQDDATSEAALRQCIKQMPKFEWPYCSLAERLIDQKKLPEAEDLLNRASAINPNSIKVLVTQAKLEQAKGNQAKAQVLIKKAIDQDPFLSNLYVEWLKDSF